MRDEPAATIARGLLLAASLGAIVWSGAVLGRPGVPKRPAAGDAVSQPKIRGVLADLVFKSSRRGSVAAEWPTNWPEGLRPLIMGPHMAGGTLFSAAARLPQPEFWLPAPTVPAGWRIP